MGEVKDNGSQVGIKHDFTVVQGHDKDFGLSQEPNQGELKSIGRLENAERTGIWVSVRDSELVTTTEWKRGQLEGIVVFYEHSNPSLLLEYSAGKRHGWLWVLPSPGKSGIADEFAYGKGVSDLNEFGVPKSYIEPPKYTKAKMSAAIDEHQMWAARVLARILNPDEVREILRKHAGE